MSSKASFFTGSSSAAFFSSARRSLFLLATTMAPTMAATTTRKTTKPMPTAYVRPGNASPDRGGQGATYSGSRWPISSWALVRPCCPRGSEPSAAPSPCSGMLP